MKRKIIPLFIDDDNVVIEREKIINMHNVFMKETNNEYTNSHMNNVFNMLNQNEQNDLLDSLFEFSGLNTKIGAEAAELYTLITK